MKSSLLCRLVAVSSILLGGMIFRAGQASEEVPNGAPSDTREAERSIEELTNSAKKSIVVISFTGRDGRGQGLGSGFVVSKDGLIATNFHVIGEGRPINVQMSDGRKLDVESVEAYDRHVDLALIKVKADDLIPLPLGDSDKIRQGQAIIALGNPQGLKFSVVAGVLSGTQEIERRTMLQLAIPIESGNSGGPVLDRAGNVLGIVTMKSAVTPNLGFAMPVNELKRLQEKPNPTVMARWLTIGALDPREWVVPMGGRWKQRAGRILVEGTGDGFGGRALCISTADSPGPEFEVATMVKLDNEEGAAGLAFCSDGGDRHYGFYPTGGRLRLTCFLGPDVNSWNILSDIRSEHYRPGEWNHLRVKVSEKTIACYLNGELVITAADDRLRGGRSGLAKFRTTMAEFKRFQQGVTLTDESASPELTGALTDLLAKADRSAGAGRAIAAQLPESAGKNLKVLRDRTRDLERQLAQLRQATQAVHERDTLNQLQAELDKPEADTDLFKAALLVARLDNEEVDVESYLKELDRMVEDTRATVPATASPADTLAALNQYLFVECGFHGTRGDHYYHQSNSYVNEVLDDREGLPITLSVIYIEMARKLGVEIVGVGIPSHFMVRHAGVAADDELIDVYERAAPVGREALNTLVRSNVGRPLQASDLEAMTKRGMVLRILRNLRGLAEGRRETESLARYLDAIVLLEPENPEERIRRAILCYTLDRREDALADTNWLIEKKPRGVNLEQVEELRQAILRNTRP